MPRVMQVQPLTMGWCLDCHRNSRVAPERLTAPHDAWEAAMGLLTDPRTPDRAITGLTTCTACHR
jgi:hypothetical protein